MQQASAAMLNTSVHVYPTSKRERGLIVLPCSLREQMQERNKTPPPAGFLLLKDFESQQGDRHASLEWIECPA